MLKNGERLKMKIGKEIDEIADRGEMKASDIEFLYKMTDIIKNLDKIEMLEEQGGYSENSYRHGSYGGSYGSSYGDGSYGSYNDGMSNARQGQHYVRGHYSYGDEGSLRGMSNARGRGYSRAEAKDEMMNKLGEMMGEADESQRHIIKKAMRELEEV